MDFSLETFLINRKWKNRLKDEFLKDYVIQLENFLKNEYKNNKIIYPEQKNIFSALNKVDLDQTKVVILGQDPYHGAGEAHGLSFSVPANIKIPPSLRNIYKELASDIGVEHLSGDLSHWADQGVLLLNTVLTVEKDKAGSHQKKGWEILTDKIISAVSEENSAVVFILWGAPAQKKIPLIDASKHLIISGVHPSPLSSYRGFFGSKPFSKANEWLVKHGKEKLNW